MSEFRPKGAPAPQRKKYVEHPGLPADKPYLQVSISNKLRVDAYFKKIPKKMFKDTTKSVEKLLIKEFKNRGFPVVKVDSDDLAELANTLYSFAGEAYSDVGGAGFKFLTETVRTGEGFAEHWKHVAGKAVTHMRTIAYKTPKERRGGKQLRHLYGKSAEKPYVGKKDKKTGMITRTRGPRKGEPYRQQIYKPLSWVVSRYKGPGGISKAERKEYEAAIHPRQVKRTGRLRDSIDYKIDYKYSKKRRALLRISGKANQKWSDMADLAFGFQVGPGAGNTPAPPYAWAANYGRSSISGRHYTPQDYFKDQKGGALTSGGYWPGFEGKFFLEKTVEWLRRKEAKGPWTAGKYARAHISKVLADCKKTFPDVPVHLYEQLEATALKAIRENDQVMTEELLKELDHQVQRHF